MRNVEATAVYDKVIINAQTVLDAPVLLHWLFQASFIIWEATDDGLFKGSGTLDRLQGRLQR